MKRARLNVPFTMVPHSCFDEYMRELTPNEFQTYLFVIRKTVGWHKRTDEIALSQFKEFINSSIPTIRKAIKGLREKGFVKQVPSGKSYEYTILKPRFNFIFSDDNEYNTERNLQGIGKESFNEPCKNLTTQKKEQKIKLNTTSSNRTKIRDEVPSNEIILIINKWNQLFNTPIDSDNKNWKELIREVLQYFSIEELEQAMQNRLHSDFYQGKNYPLLHSPKSFFGWLATIDNDLHRTPSNIYTYDEMIKLVTDLSNSIKNEDFEKRADLKDVHGYAKWEYMKV